MGYTALVAPELTSGLIDAGEKLIQSLDAAGIKVIGAFWLLSSEDVGWRLFIASPEVSQTGARQFYSKIDKQVRALAHSELSVSHITAVRPDDSMVSLLRSAIRTGQPLSRIRFSRNVVNGTLIPDALIYRLL